MGRAGDSHRRRDDAPGTVRPDRTVASGPETEVPRPRGLLLGGAVVVLAAAAGVGYWLLSKPSPALSPGDVAQETVGILTEALLTSKVELARGDLDNRDYRAAANHAREALAIDAGNPEALEVLERAESASQQLDAAAAEATTAFGQGDTSRASEALGRVMALDPRHPVADKLSGELNRFFRRQAEESRGQAARARTGAEGGRATGETAFRRASALSGEADGLFRQGQYAVAAQKYLESRDAFEAAGRAAETRRAIATPPPVRVAPGVPSPSPTALAQGPLAPPPATLPAPPPGQVATPVASAATVPSPSPSAVLPAAPTRELPEAAAVQRVIDDYVRAIETKDLGLFRALMPDLTPDQEKTLRDSFGAIKVQRVSLSGLGVQVDGSQATARVTRQDTINGRPMKPVQQTFRLERQSGSWRIRSFAFER
jgi:tetratricopeptide (TPR) repeat protein